MASIKGEFRAYTMNNGIQLVLDVPGAGERKFIVKDGDLGGTLHEFLKQEIDGPS
jgi:hypothetical protein